MQIGRAPQMCLIHADFKHFRGLESERFSLSPQGLVNHVSQGLVNHAGECRAGDARLTSLFKPISARARLRSRAIDREHNPGGETKP